MISTQGNCSKFSAHGGENVYPKADNADFGFNICLVESYTFLYI